MPPSGAAFPGMFLWEIFPIVGVSCPADSLSEGRESLEDPAPQNLKQVDLCSGICRSFSSILPEKGFKL